MDKAGSLIQNIIVKELKDFQDNLTKRIDALDKKIDSKPNKKEAEKIVESKLFSIQYDLGELKKNYDQLNNKSDKHFDDIMSKLDFIYGKIKKMDDSQEMMSYRVTEHTNELGNHEKRILKIEKSPSFVSA